VTGLLRHLAIVVAIAGLPPTPAAGQGPDSIDRRRPWDPPQERDRVAFRSESDDVLPLIAAAVRERGVVDSAVIMAHRHLKLPKLLFTAQSCGRPNAYYLPRSGEVVVCFEMLLDAYRLLNRHENRALADTHGTGRRLADAVGFAQFLFAHELGHAVIHRYKVPVVGEEEAAADQFALWLLSEDRAGPGLAVAHYVFVLLSVHEEWTDERVVDPHGLDLRRAHRIACWLASIDELRPATMLTVAERQHCAMAVAQAREAWSRLLGPYRRRRRSVSRPYFVTDASRVFADSSITARGRRRTR
jgi:hypothetical protein